MFQFKQFSVDQTGCAMKINTDGVLLGAMAGSGNPESILDIGTGTGVIALMLAQKFEAARIDAVEIDPSAAATAERNFKDSVFNDRLTIYPSSVEKFFDDRPNVRYDLIVSNPPFYLNSLESPEERKTLAKHTDGSFFERLMKDISRHLSRTGVCWLIYPYQEAIRVKELIERNQMNLQLSIDIHSFEHSAPHRQIACFGFEEVEKETEKFVIYEAMNVYSDRYRKLLQPFFLAF